MEGKREDHRVRLSNLVPQKKASGLIRKERKVTDFL